MNTSTLYILNGAAQANDFFSSVVVFLARYFVVFLIAFVFFFVVSRFIPRGRLQDLFSQGGVSRLLRRVAVSVSASAAILFFRYVLGRTSVDTKNTTTTLQARGMLMYGHGLSTETIERIKKYRSFLMTVFFSPLVALLATVVLKSVVRAPRPFVSLSEVTPLFRYGGTDSFPSGHAAVSMAIAIAVFCYYPRLGIGLFFASVLISLSRVAAGIHFPVDILAGSMIGLFFAFVTHAIVVRYYRRRNNV